MQLVSLRLAGRDLSLHHGADRFMDRGRTLDGQNTDQIFGRGSRAKNSERVAKKLPVLKPFQPPGVGQIPHDCRRGHLGP